MNVKPLNSNYFKHNTFRCSKLLSAVCSGDATEIEYQYRYLTYGAFDISSVPFDDYVEGISQTDSSACLTRTLTLTFDVYFQ